MTDDEFSALWHALLGAVEAAHPGQDAAAAALARQRATARLVCLERGCRESVGYVEIYVRDGRPVARLEIRAPHAYEPSDDARAMHGTRIRLTGAIDGRRDVALLEFSEWSPGARILLVCRHGHESAYGAGELARRLRRASDVLI